MRPIGGFAIGRIGDVLGRKFTIMLTTFIMAISCLVMATVPTYEKIGITATIILIICRMSQGLASLGEIVGAQLYLSEFLKTPYRCVASGLMGFAETMGGFLALAMASFVTSMDLSWRYVFIGGAFIAVIGFIARTKLRETPDFVNHKLRIAKKMEQNNQDIEKIQNIYDEKINKKTVLAYAFTEFHFPICFYTSYVCLGDFFVKEVLGLTSDEVVSQNLKVTVFLAVALLVVACLAKKVHPVKTAIISALFFSVVLPLTPY